MLSRLKIFASSYTGRLLVGGLLIHALVLPLIFFAMLSHESGDREQEFVSHAREQAYLLWSHFNARRGDTAIPRLLDEMITGGGAEYAEYIPLRGAAVPSGLNTPQARFREDDAFGGGDDHMFYVLSPTGPDGGRLRLGFSEVPVEEDMREGVRLAAILAAAYLASAFVLISVFGDRLADAVIRLRAVSRRIADGEMGEPLAIDTPVREISALADDLERMRQSLLLRERDMAQREARQRAVVETAAEGIVTVNPQGRIESFNRAAESLFECAAQEAIGQSFTRFLAPQEVGKFFNPAGEPARCSSAEFVGRRHGGQKCHLMLSVSEAAAAGTRCFTILIQDISERLAYEAQLAYQATHDALTGLPNRALFQDRLTQVLTHAQRESNIVGLFFLDLDHFKQINDTLGHHVGDELLQAVAKRLRGCLRSEDTLARLGGDEFTIILPHLEKPTHSVTVAENIVETLEKPFQIAGKDLLISCSIGIAFFPFDGREAAELSRNADAAMYATKNQGGHGFHFYSQDLNATAASRQELDTRLRLALERDELMLHYQPQVDIHTLRIVGVEALLRWQHPERGLLPSGEFFSLAEETSAIIPIGHWILEAACRQARAWEEAGMAVPVSVNLSPNQFRDPDLVPTVRKALLHTGLRPRLLNLELTETLLRDRCKLIAGILQQLKDLGVTLSLDDFGIGASSLAYLKRLPIDALKIDQSFIREIDGDDSDGTLAATVIAMARSLRMHVMAEGVESDAQLAYLRNRGCEIFQGFHFSRALPAEEATALLRASLRPEAPLGRAA